MNAFIRVEKRGPRAENKAVTDTTFHRVSRAEGPKKDRRDEKACDTLPMFDALKA